MVVGLSGLLARRFFVDRIRAISAPSDYLMLVLILLIAGSGLVMRFVDHADIVKVKQFVLGLLQFNITTFPGGGALFVHLLLVALLLIIFPFSKLLHAPGLFFSPSRNQIDNPREQRHAGQIADSRLSVTQSDSDSSKSRNPDQSNKGEANG